MLSAISRPRLIHQRLAGAQPVAPAAVVAGMGMLQAQDYLGALWAVGLRAQQVTQAGVEQALAQRQIVRTWPARGTLHFVAAPDVRWLLDLLAPRAIARSAGRFRQLELDEPTLARSRRLIARALQAGPALTREALYQVLEAGGVSPLGQRGIHILGRLAQEGLICFGARAGQQHTFVLLDEWVPAAESLPRELALAELARRYITSHGPATVLDFVWWSGLTTSDARAGLDLARPHLEPDLVAGQTYWRPRSKPAAGAASRSAHLLPAFDEYLVGYTDRTAVLDPRQVKQINAGGGMLSPVIVVGGQVAGTWKRTLRRGAVTVTPSWFAAPTPATVRAFTQAVRRYGRFLERPAEVSGPAASLGA